MEMRTFESHRLNHQWSSINGHFRSCNILKKLIVSSYNIRCVLHQTRESKGESKYKIRECVKRDLMKSHHFSVAKTILISSFHETAICVHKSKNILERILESVKKKETRLRELVVLSYISL